MRCSLPWRLLISLLLLLSVATAHAAEVAAAAAVSPSSSSVVQEEECLYTSNDDELIAMKYLQDGNASSFRFNGWRWHTMSVLRELKLLQQSVQRTNSISGANHVIGFNMKGLHNVEKSLFFPWLQKNLVTDDEVTKTALQRVLSTMVQQQELLEEQGQRLLSQTTSTATSSTTLQSMVNTLQNMVHVQNTIIVPAVSLLVPESVQESMNTKILRSMGLLDSRLYLVGMHEAVKDNEEELALFQRDIPSIARFMLSRWKRNLYDARTSMFCGDDE